MSRATTRCITLPDALIRAALAGRVTEIRVPMTPQPEMREIHRPTPEHRIMWGRRPHVHQTTDQAQWLLDCPLGQPGDRLVVREAWGR